MQHKKLTHREPTKSLENKSLEINRIIISTKRRALFISLKAMTPC